MSMIERIKLMDKHLKGLENNWLKDEKKNYSTHYKLEEIKEAPPAYLQESNYKDLKMLRHSINTLKNLFYIK